MSPAGLPPRDSAEKSLGDIVSEVTEKAQALVQAEIELAKAEVTDKLSKLGKGAGIAAAAGVFLVFGVTPMFFFFLAFILNDLFAWNGVWPGFLVVTIVLLLLAALAGFIAYRLFQRNARIAPDLAIEQAKLTRAQLDQGKIEHDQVKRTIEKGAEVKA